MHLPKHAECTEESVHRAAVRIALAPPLAKNHVKGENKT
jgi:hypothetical protein